MKQTTAGIRELKNHLSAYLRKVKAGETITITDRGTPVGRIVPAGEKDKRTLEEKLQALQDAGLAEWSGKEAPTARTRCRKQRRPHGVGLAS